MPYLNWKDVSPLELKQEIRPALNDMPKNSAERLRMSFSLLPERRDELVSLLSEVFATSGELRIDLPLKWTLFWKLRDGDSRLLMAHPEEDQWVGTASLNERHAKMFLEKLSTLQSSQSLELGGMVGGTRMGAMNNLEVCIRVD